MNGSNRPLNGTATANCEKPDVPVVLKEMLKGGLLILWRGCEYARNLGLESWEFAVEQETLARAGLLPIDLHWLMSRGYVEMAPRVTSPECRQGLSPPCNGSHEEQDACFFLTRAGMAYVSLLLTGGSPPTPRIPAEQECARDGEEVHDLEHCANSPKWDRARKELRFGDCIVKQFRWSAVNQEAILMAFEEEGWPPRIDDPLPGKQDQDPKQRLHDTVKCLNRNHKKRLIRFTGDGTGEGVLWLLQSDVEGEA
ncbi:MAG: hypothetical protein IAF94_21885 [Pirellulaceae bacterium]|nr:hypothetical protein [Pirellulaceae bacterium]